MTKKATGQYVTIDLSGELARDLQDEARRRGKPVEMLVAQILREQMAEQKRQMLRA